MKSKLVLLTLPLVIACATKEKSKYEMISEYEGKYEYFASSTLQLVASQWDTTLYAVIDDAKYPLTYVSKDTFENRSKDPVIFQRDEQGKVKSYQTDNSTFQLLTTDVAKQEWFPRKALFNRAKDYVYTVPDKINDGLEVGNVEQAFANPNVIQDMVMATINGEYPDVHSILIWKDGKLVLEEYFYEYNIDKPHQLRSATKSFIAPLVGIAIDQGKIKSENEKLLPFFKDKYETIANMDKRKEQLTIQDFLTYRHGMDCENDNPESKGYEQAMMESNDWAKYTLDLPMTGEPGVTSSYCTGCPLTVGRLVEIATQTPLVDYADKHLFAPMGITEYKWRFQPDTTSKTTFNQMYLRPRDMLKLAVMHKDNGKWLGKQIVPADWIKRTFGKHDVEFGYLWRHKRFEVDGKIYNSYLATGNGGQKINIWPELNMITVFTGGNYNSFLYGKQTPPNEMIPKYILKALE